MKAESLGMEGEVMDDPPWLVYLGHHTEPLGDVSLAYPPHELMEFVVTRVEGVPVGDVREHCRKHDPVVTVVNTVSWKKMRMRYGESAETIIARFQNTFHGKKTRVRA